ATLARSDQAALERVNAWLGGSAEEAPAARVGAQVQLQAQSGAQPMHAGSSRRNAQTLFSQLTAPLAAKAIEDTACYRYGRLLSRNEVGADPGEFALSVEQFHAGNLERAQRFPHALLATATHVFAALVSEISYEWSATLRAW